MNRKAVEDKELCASRNKSYKKTIDFSVNMTYNKLNK